ncbi:MAG: hypothetical protein D6693_09505 [Planctomycetota bacterium]|nr:MAG: hypothetical protein D6693_09505 [Planctomycetota bacterium]
MTGAEIVDRDFLDARARLLDLAAFLDRLDRAADGAGRDDPRVRALLDAMRQLGSTEPGRVARIQVALSDPTTEPIDRLPDRGAAGAWTGAAHGADR